MDSLFNDYINIKNNIEKIITINEKNKNRNSNKQTIIKFNQKENEINYLWFNRNNWKFYVISVQTFTNYYS